MIQVIGNSAVRISWGRSARHTVPSTGTPSNQAAYTYGYDPSTMAAAAAAAAQAGYVATDPYGNYYNTYGVREFVHVKVNGAQ